MYKLVDSHHHITGKLTIDGIYNTYNFEGLSNIKDIYQQNISIGIHPLYIEKNINWDYIIQLFKSNPLYNVGEVGLDRRGSNRILEKEVFNTFIDLTNRYERSISIHCVKYWGELVNMIKNKLNRELPHLFHGYSGSKETMDILLSGNSYFSFSLEQLKNPRIIQLIKSIPIEKLLIESDMLNEEFLNKGQKIYLDNLLLTYIEMSKIKQISIQELTNNIHYNFNQFLRSNHI